MADPRGHELLGTGRTLWRLRGNCVSGMLEKTPDHMTSKTGLPTLVLRDFFQCRLSASHPNPPFMDQTIPTERKIASLRDIQAEVYSQEEKGGKTRSKSICGSCFFLVIVQTSPTCDSQ